ncbi:sugar ABC transporter ATP-binding protein [Microbacterium sp. zg-Y818]|uniref:sugar ABC transporter ATP-binding protein n=1 Tax=unclassified Microbacterium TaxID=2609290 RepID=UPI00214BC7DD|nr:MULTISPECIES: sugar ABC transporter ATP-binding protein [unclassified Microbacterium]MCR2800132.1 sugar ABC transporter ATP-binding protein [Microbacterium sp. zg.Y818]WIM22103.1 sugar ABC transporter ATP-binding protein [Microbacterium sp. zg-Y818]
MSAPALEMRGISKSFPGVKALSDVDLVVAPGEVHAIVGENGAGKSTLMKILAGLYQPDTGTIELAGERVRIAGQLDALRRGIGMVYQELNLVPDLTVAENIALGATPSRLGFVRRRSLLDSARAVLDALDARIDPRARLGSLTVSQQQLVEIAKAYAARPKIMVLDEPTSSLSEHEAQALFRVVRAMRADGIAIIYISHRLREVLDLADHVTVLRDGRQIDTRPVSGLTAAEMITLMVGRELTDVFPKREVPIGEVVLEVDGLSRAGAFDGVSLTVRAGEIVGLAGLVGAGRTEIARAVFGLDKADAGTVRVNGADIRARSPRQAVNAGIAYVPEDRKRDGIIPESSIRDNIALPVLSKVGTSGWISSRRERALATEQVNALGVSPPDVERAVNTLSGGNQQKVVIAKWLATQPDVLLLDEPTRGVDVGAKADIHTIIGELAGRGVAILLISSELPEVLAVSDRIYVLTEGRVSAEFTRDDADERSIMHAATGEASQ